MRITSTPHAIIHLSRLSLVSGSLAPLILFHGYSPICLSASQGYTRSPSLFEFGSKIASPSLVQVFTY
eukprot:m.204241 g.204241  ORF g.204241 m.204241 type:complete len:68 (-) comp16882_c4_seq6:2379-2582(-)